MPYCVAYSRNVFSFNSLFEMQQAVFLQPIAYNFGDAFNSLFEMLGTPGAETGGAPSVFQFSI